MVDAHATLETLRSIKNTIIGNPTAKKKLASDGTVALVLEWINASERTGEPIFEQIRIEAAHIIAAQAYGPPEALVAVLEAQAPQALVTALRDAVSFNAPRLVVALTRALRSVISAAAETIGPVRWHFQRDAAHPARLEARLVLEDTFSSDALNVILPYLMHSEPDVRRNIALLLARGLVVDAHRTRISEYDGRAAIWSLIGMLGGDTRNKSAAAYALAEITRDNDTMARILTDWIPINVISMVTSTTLSGSGWDHIDRIVPVTSGGAVARERPSIRIPGTETGSLLSMTRPPHSPSQRARGDVSIEQIKDEHVRVLDIICKFLPSRDGDMREAACLCISTIVRQLRPPNPFRDPIHAMVMWLNLALEEFAPTPDSSLRIPTPDPSANMNPKTQWMQKCRWKPNEIGGGEVARRVVGACHILADFVNDREDLLTYVIHAGTLQRAVRALLVLPPIPIPPGKPPPALSGRWGPGSSSSPSSGVPPVPAPAPQLAPPNPNVPSGLARTRRASSVTRTGYYVPLNPPPGFIPIPEALLNARTRGPTMIPSLAPSSTPAAGPSSVTGPASPMPMPVSPPPPIVSAAPVSPPPPVQRRLSFAELARRASESGGEGFTRRTPSGVRRTSSAGAGTPVVSESTTPRVGAGTPVPGTSGTTEASAGTGVGGSTEARAGSASDPSSGAVTTRTAAAAEGRTDDAMAVDSEAGGNQSRANEDVTMISTEPTLSTQTTDVAMSNTGASSSAAPPRRRKKPPPDPALGPYTSTSTPSPTASTPCHPLPPAPESSLRSALLILLASLTMHSDEHRRLLVEAGALGGVVPPGRRIGVGVSPGKGGDIEGVTGVLGALGSPDPEVRWAGVMVTRAIGRSMSVLRTGLYDSGIGRATFDMLMQGEPDRRVLVAVLRVCCNLLNQYSAMREMFIRDGGMKKLAELCDAEEQTIRVLSLWALRNSLFRATFDEKRTIMGILGWEKLERALDEPPGELLEQALGIVRNISAIELDAEWLITCLPPSKLLDATERTLGADESASSASLFALAHVAFIPSVRSLILGRRRVLEFICSSLGHSEVLIRGAAALCIAQMAGCTPRRLREMREVGIDGRLKVMRARETDEDVRDNVSRALSMFESRDV